MTFDVVHTKGSLSAGAGHQSKQEETTPTRIYDAIDKKHAERLFYSLPIVKIFGKKIIRMMEVHNG
ncbi:MAG TPA: hypothetical protein PK573_02270 [Spirochaetota bacterium]|nr:hypothetical protein [Spirochaetota bacterium]HRZ28708.1 hypothetical protein [Spirochaetota bacterium]